MSCQPARPCGTAASIAERAAAGTTVVMVGHRNSVLAIADQMQLPISLVGIGEGLEDWEPFDPEAYAKGLFE